MKKEFTKQQADNRKLKLAEQLVDQWQDDKFKFDAYQDRYRQKVKTGD